MCLLGYSDRFCRDLKPPAKAGCCRAAARSRSSAWAAAFADRFDVVYQDIRIEKSRGIDFSNPALGINEKHFQKVTNDDALRSVLVGLSGYLLTKARRRCSVSHYSVGIGTD